jgi:hypothetical protein
MQDKKYSPFHIRSHPTQRDGLLQGVDVGDEVSSLLRLLHAGEYLKKYAIFYDVEIPPEMAVNVGCIKGYSVFRINTYSWEKITGYSNIY